MREKMRKTLSRVLLLVMFITAGASSTAWGALRDLGIPKEPHGFPDYYMDSTGLMLEPCLPAPAGNATRQDLCIFDPLQGGPLQVGSELFYWMAESSAPPLVAGGKALLTLALEGAFTAEEPVDGQQMTFGRVRIRVDVPVAGDYTVTHPFGTQVFENVTVADGINFTSDIGSISILDPALGFRGALTSAIGPFLAWPNYHLDPTLQVRALDPVTGLPTGPVLEQYVGDPNVPHIVTGGTNGNVFRIQGPNGSGIDVQTDLFTVMGKLYDSTVQPTPHVFPATPPRNLFEVGPVNREEPFRIPTIGTVTETDHTGYPLGYPLWFQEALPVLDPDNNPVLDPVTQQPLQQGGLQLTICPASDPMCISAPVDPADPGSVEVRAGEESFWWSGEAFINGDTADVQNLPAGLDGILVLALEGAFGGLGVPADGQQIAFGRVRIRVDVPVAGTYSITHPYGVEVFENVTVADGINMTRDIMIIDPADPDGAFVGALYSNIGPRFLTWPDYTNRDPVFLAANPEYASLQRQVDPTDLTSPIIQYVGDPTVPHVVTGSPNDTNFFRIEGPNGIDVRTELFTVTGKVFDPLTFEVVANPLAPVANPDAASLNMANATAVTINVLNNDTINDAAINPANVTVAVLPAGALFGPDFGAVTVDPATDTVTYTPDAAFAATGGVDTFAYQVTDTATGLTSGNAIVTVTVVPRETIAVTRARLDLRKLRWDISGTSNFDGTTLTIRAGATASGPVIGTATVNGGLWSFRGGVTSNPNVTSITVVSPNGTTVTQPLQVR